MAKRIQDRSTTARPNEILQTPAPLLEAPQLLSTKQAAAFLKRKPQTLAIWRCKQRYTLPYLKIGGAVLYRVADLRAFLEASVVTPEGARNPKRRAKS